jgi:hypothetical protein
LSFNILPAVLLRELRTYGLTGLAAGAALLLAACGGPAPEILLDTDFDHFQEWGIAPPGGLTDQMAHSGSYCIKTEPGMDYAATYSTSLERLSFVPRKLDFSMWVYLTNGRTREIGLVTQVQRDGRGPDMWTALPLEQVVKRYGQWEHVQHTVYLPSGLSPQDRVRVYLWHQDSHAEATYLDDLRIVAQP